MSSYRPVWACGPTEMAIGKMTKKVGVSMSSVSRQARKAARERLKKLAQRLLDNRD